MGMNDKEAREAREAFVRGQIEKMRAATSATGGFFCACCGKPKPEKELAGFHEYKPQSEELAKAAGRRVGVYGICLECVELPDDQIHQRVTRSQAAHGLFGGPP